MITRLDICGALLSLCLWGLSAASVGQEGDGKSLDEDFLLFLGEWVDESGEVIEPAELEPVLDKSASQGEKRTGEVAQPLEEQDG